MSIGIEIHDGVTPALKSFQDQMPALLESGTLRVAEDVAGEIRRQIFQRLKKDPTGGLARSFRPPFLVLNRSKTSFDVGVFSDLIYAEIQDGGGVIKAKKKMLAIPIEGAPVPRGKWPRQFGKNELTFISKHKGPNPVSGILAKVSKSGKVTPMYALRKSVTIKGVGYIDAAINESVDPAEKALGEGIELTIKKSIDAGAK